jgi:broad specificity phosphatase PhoE
MHAIAENATRWWWVRHAPVAHLRHEIYGSTDPDCDTSHAQAFTSLARKLPVDAVWVVSSLRRTHQTARAIGRAGYALPELLEEPDLGEQNFGDLHGRTHTEHAATRRDSFTGFWPLPPDQRAPNGESLMSVQARVLEVVQRLGREHRGRDIVCVSHGGPILSVVSHALGLELGRAVSISLPNLSLTLLHELHEPLPEGPRWRAICVGERAHG